MKGIKHISSLRFRQQVSSFFMIAALLWLTVSLPFIYASQQQLEKAASEKSIVSNNADSEDNSDNPLNNTTEEKAPSSVNLSEEYLHDHHSTQHFFFEALQFHKCENARTYIAYHGELLVPPPNHS